MIVTDASTHAATRIYLSSPHMSGLERHFVAEAFDRIGRAGRPPHEAYEREFATASRSHAVADTSGTAPSTSLILAASSRARSAGLRSHLHRQRQPDLYLGARPVFIDSERDSWNMDPACSRRP